MMSVQCLSGTSLWDMLFGLQDHQRDTYTQHHKTNMLCLYLRHRCQLSTAQDWKLHQNTRARQGKEDTPQDLRWSNTRWYMLTLEKQSHKLVNNLLNLQYKQHLNTNLSTQTRPVILQIQKIL